MFNAQLLSEADLEQIAALGGVGDVCGYFYDQQGELLDLELHRRLIGISWEGLTRIPVVVGVAGGRRKAPAILGALRSGVIDYLVTDSEAAELILALDATTARGQNHD
jgi:DNA-binding transcriptional regulator LsrR (DeoR family)